MVSTLQISRLSQQTGERHMRKFLTYLFMLTFLLACGGGNGSGNPTTGASHNDLASIFVNKLNATGQYDVELVKKSTLQYNYIVLYDRDYGTYDAYDLTGFSETTDIMSFVNANNNYFFYDLIRIPAHYDIWDNYVPTRYEDPYTGTLFERITATAKDLEKMAALTEQVTIARSANHIETQLGLSADRSLEIARLAVQWNKNKDTLTNADHDAFASEIIGVSITDAKNAVNSAFIDGNQSSLNQVISTAAETNGVSVEHMNVLIQELFVE